MTAKARTNIHLRPAATVASTRQEARSRKAKAVLLAGIGPLAGVGTVLAVKVAGLSQFSMQAWLVMLAVSFAVTFALWLVPASGLSERLTWDPHWVLVPCIVQGCYICSLVVLAPEVRFLALLSYQVGILTCAGLLRFRDAIVSGACVGAVYWIALSSARQSGFVVESLRLEVAMLLFFLTAQVFAAFSLGRVRREREKRLQFQRSLMKQAFTDVLTGLPNRRQFEDVVAREEARSRRYESRFAIALFDIDHFKQCNDRFGHALGDEVLRTVAVALKQHSREADFVARLAGDEFVVVLPNASAEDAMKTAERARRAVEESEIGSSGASVTLSIGIALYPEHAEDWHSVLAAADSALYQSKELGRNRVTLAAVEPVAKRATSR